MDRETVRKRRSRIHLRVPLAGWLFLVVSLLVGIAAFRSSMPLMFVILGVMWGAFLVSGIFARRMLSGVTVHRELPERAWQSDTLYFGYYLNNVRRSSCLGISLRELNPYGVEDACGYCMHLPGRGRFRSGSRLSAHRRGRVRLKDILLSTRFPFGLVASQRRVSQPITLVVWPAKGYINRDLLRRGATAATTAHPGRQQGGQDEFFGLREYRMGDNMRWIHWRRSAGRDKPIVREMAHPLPEVLFLILDVRRNSLDELVEAQRERLLRFAATLIDNTLGRGYQVGMALADEKGPCIISPSAGVGARCELLDILANVRDPRIGLETIIPAIPPRDLRDAQTILVCPDPGKMNQLQLARLASRCKNFTALGHKELGSIFVDNPHVAREGL